MQEPAPPDHPPVAQRGVAVNEPASHRAIPVGADDQVEVHCAARAKMQRRAVRPRFDQLDDRGTAVPLVRDAPPSHWYRWAQLTSVKLSDGRTSPSHRCWPVPDPRVTNRK